MKVGDYVRTIDGISKITDIRHNNRVGNLIQTEEYKYIWYKEREIIKTSPNIIDLLKEWKRVKIMTNEELKNLIEKYDKETNKLFKENKKLKEANKNLVKSNCKFLQQRIDKAIEYINAYMPNYDFDHYNLEKLLKILKGEKNE